MPELPEVETLCRQLHAKIAGEKIIAMEVYDNKFTGLENVTGRTVEKVRRVGKTILIMLNDDRSITIHLRMTGRLLWRPDKKKEKHTRWRMTIPTANIDLVDPRRFATIRIESKSLDKGRTDLMIDFDERTFLTRHAVRKVSVKVLMMDPKAIAGIGNIYACEILHQTGISPFRQAATLSEREWKSLFRQAKRILKKGIEKRGTSISDWRDLYGCKGQNQEELRVYGQEGKNCCTCGGVIERIKQNGRSTFYCPRCQE